MNGANILNNFLKKGINPLLIASNNVLLQQTRNTFILKRRNPDIRYKVNYKPPHLKRKDYIYDFVENTNYKKKPPIELILTSYVEGIGNPGDTVKIPRLKAYNEFLLPGLAVYASPENIKKYQVKNINTDDFKYSSHFVSRTVDYLSKELITVTMSNVNPWKLEKWHVRSAFRRAGIILKEENITIPDKEISGPNMYYDNKEFFVTVTINNREKVNVRCRISHWHDYAVSPIKFIEPSVAIFPEDQKILDEMPEPYVHQKHREKLENESQDK